jgi:DNA polymerase
MALGEIEAQATECKKCKLWINRKNVVFGSGPLNPQVMLIGEAPFQSHYGLILTSVGKWTQQTCSEMMEKFFYRVEL